MARAMTKRQLVKRRARFRALAGMADFFGVVGSCAAVIVCALLISALVAWMRADVPETFKSVIYAVETATSLGGM